MDQAKKNILLTGLPGVGKTTLIKRLSDALSGLHPIGFYTEEIREKDARKGFALVSLVGGKRLFSHTEINSPYKVGRYKVDIKGFEDFLDEIAFFNPENKLIIIDEIGKMECLSSKFSRLMKDVLSSDKILITTIALRGGGLIEEIKKRDDVKSFGVTQSNRESLIREILSAVQRLSNNVSK
jgi:nucleoside-triphosphatase